MHRGLVERRDQFILLAGDEEAHALARIVDGLGDAVAGLADIGRETLMGGVNRVPDAIGVAMMASRSAASSATSWRILYSLSA